MTNSENELTLCSYKSSCQDNEDGCSQQGIAYADSIRTSVNLHSFTPSNQLLLSLIFWLFSINPHYDRLNNSPKWYPGYTFWNL